MNDFEKALMSTKNPVQEFECKALGKKVFFKQIGSRDYQSIVTRKQQFVLIINMGEKPDSEDLAEVPFFALEKSWCNADGSLMIQTDDQKEKLRAWTDCEAIEELSMFAYTAVGINKKKPTSE